MKYVFGILGGILLLPIILTLVVLIVVSLIGAYAATVAYFCWWIIAIGLAVWIIIRIVKKFL